MAATVGADTTTETDPYHRLLDGLGIPRPDQLIRPIAKRGNADQGVTLTVETLVPEITVTADGVYWHPVAADQIVTTTLFPLADAIDGVRRRYAENRLTATVAAQRFLCA